MNLFSQKKEKANRELIEQILLEKYNQYYQLAYRYAHSEQDAFDIVQSGACKAIKSSQTLKKPEYAKTCIYRIMLNECFQYLKQPRHFSFEEVQDKNETELGAAEDRYADIDLHKALNALADRDRAVVILKYFEDRKISEIAEILGENVNTVKSRLYRSMRKLQSLLSDGNMERNGERYEESFFGNRKQTGIMERGIQKTADVRAACGTTAADN